MGSALLPTQTNKIMSNNNKTKEVVRCYCFSNNGKLHCPLTTNESDLKGMFNYFTEHIVWVDIYADFVCKETRKPSCKNCPFK